ncbi:MAG: hypothetical protein HY337_11300 [Gemmatimonadetes bacterium]|nr:hypothetical protein [Gemmatimonadota bacterium]
MEDILAIILIFGGGSAFLLAISPVGRAIADRIRSGPAAAADESLGRLHETQQAILDDLESVRQELTDLQERMDFTERLLAQHRESGRLPERGQAGGGA